MFNLNILCNICKIAFKESDNIYTSSCGHLFHYHCANQWRSRPSNCLKCSTSNLASQPIFVNIDRTQDYETIINELKIKLKSSNDISEELEKEIIRLKACITENQNQFANIQKSYMNSKELTKELEYIIDNLTRENKKLKSDLALIRKNDGVRNNNSEKELKQTISELSAENKKLKESINESESSSMVLNYKNELLEKKLKHLTYELRKVISENFNKPKENTIKPKENTIKPEEKDTSDHILEANEDLNNSTENLKQETQSDTYSQKSVLAHPNDTKIFIKSFPRQELIFPLEYTILPLASKMSISLTIDEILDIQIHDNAVDPHKVGILVEFKRISTKIEFLMLKHRLRSYPSTKYLQIKEFIDETIYPIFVYANNNLRSKGYEYIYCKNNQVYVKKSADDVEEIPIEDKRHVDRLVADT